MKQLTFILLFISNLCIGQTSPKAPSEAEVYRSLDENAKYLLKESKGNSVSIGVYLNGKTYSRHYGEIDKGKKNKATDETLFEIASVTKTFTGTLMARAVLEGKVKMDADVRDYLRQEFANLQYKGKPVTIKDLLTHRTGILRQFPNYAKLLENRDDSTAFKVRKMEENYDKREFFRDLLWVRPDTSAGSVYYYSQFGPELSAHILENAMQQDFNVQLREVIMEPNEMNHTSIRIDDNLSVANGYDDKGVLMPFLANAMWGAGGGMKSTMADLLKYMKYQLDTTNAIVKESHRSIFDDGKDEMGYFWDIGKDIKGNKFYWKHGGAYGTQNVFFVYPAYQIGFSVIINQSGSNTAGQLLDVIQGLESDLKPYGQKSIGRTIRITVEENADAGMAYYYQLKNDKKDSYNFESEGELNKLGYRLLNSGKIIAAIKIFKLNATEFPNSSNVYDSLGDAYYANKELKLAKENFKKSLKLNPANEHAKEMLKKKR